MQARDIFGRKTEEFGELFRERPVNPLQLFSLFAQLVLQALF